MVEPSPWQNLQQQGLSWPTLGWQSLRRRVLGALRLRRSIWLQALNLSDRDFDELQQALDNIGEQLALRLELRSHSGDIALLDADRAVKLSALQLAQLFKGRPVVALAGLNGNAERLLDSKQRSEHRQRLLLRQLKDLALVRRQSPRWNRSAWATSADAAAPAGADITATTPGRADSKFDSAFDSIRDADQLGHQALDGPRLAVLQAVLRGRRDPTARPLVAGYGPGAYMRFDFKNGLVSIDPLALRHLRVSRELPRPAIDAQPHADAAERDIDEMIWDLGLISGHFALANAPTDWWHTPLACTLPARITQFARTPKHIELARQLLTTPATPAELRQGLRINVADLCGFVQASLLMRLVHWVPAVESARPKVPSGAAGEVADEIQATGSTG